MVNHPMTDLERAFASGLRASPGAPLPELDGLLSDLVAAGRKAQPELALSPEVFARYVAGRLEADLSPGEVVLGLRGVIANAGDLHLACACLEQVAGAVASFERLLFRGIPAQLAGLRPTPTFVDEVLQLLRVKLFVAEAGERPRIAEYAGRGPLGGWLRVVVIRIGLTLRRRYDERPHESVREADGAIAAAADPELDHIKARYQPVFNQALKDALALLDEEQRVLLRLHFVERLSVDELGARFGVGRSTAHRRLARARDAIVDATRHLLHQRLHTSSRELDSLAALVVSQLDVSLRGL